MAATGFRPVVQPPGSRQSSIPAISKQIDKARVAEYARSKEYFISQGPSVHSTDPSHIRHRRRVLGSRARGLVGGPAAATKHSQMRSGIA
eukprot:2230555-Pleurochrysis_carterae.AAC.7